MGSVAEGKAAMYALSCRTYSNQSTWKSSDQSTAKDSSFSVTLEGASTKCQMTSVRAPSCFSVCQFSCMRFNSFAVQDSFAHTPTDGYEFYSRSISWFLTSAFRPRRIFISVII